MDDLISRQAAIDALTTECSWTIYDEHGQLTPNGEEILGTLKKIPSAQKKGHWTVKPIFPNVTLEFPMEYLECSECGSKRANATPCNFCDNCGADMRDDDDG